MPDKGKVEGLVGWIRRNYLVPMPRTASIEALNAKLIDDCRDRLGDRLRGHVETIGERLARDLAAFQSLPATPYDACEKRTGRASSLSLLRYRGTDYSVPTAYGHREVLIRGYVDEVVISCGADIIARHARSYEREDFVFEPLHYLALLEQKRLCGRQHERNVAPGKEPAEGGVDLSCELAQEHLLTLRAVKTATRGAVVHPRSADALGHTVDIHRHCWKSGKEFDEAH